MENLKHQDIVELLFLALYEDDHLSIAEDSMLQKALIALGWEESEQTGPAVGEAFAVVRKAKASDEAKEAFLVERTSRIKEAGQSALALEWLGRLLASDGLEKSEAWHLERIEKMLS
ncbi:hypothetical protein V2O64_25480 (plasmid) [Verrucomicrobiaceae bacterium 227]